MTRFKHLSIFVLTVSLIALAVAMSTQSTPALSAEQTVQRAWQRTQQAGVYHFATEIVQTTYPAPRLTNVGRSSRQETLYLEGEMNLPERAMQMTLWQNGGNILNPRDGVEIRIEGDRAYGRQLPARSGSSDGGIRVNSSSPTTSLEGAGPPGPPILGGISGVVEVAPPQDWGGQGGLYRVVPGIGMKAGKPWTTSPAPSPPATI